MSLKLLLIFIPLVTMVTVYGENDASLLGADIITQLEWLEGRWEGEFEGTPFEAIYSSPKGGVILSMSKEFGGKEPCFIEFEKITSWNEEVFLIPYPGGEKSVKFDLIDYDSTLQRLHFTNPEHDFPTDLIYERKGDSLIVEVSAPGEDGARSAVHVRMKKTD